MIELSRFLRRIALTRTLSRKEPADASIGAIGVLQPFTGSPDSHIRYGNSWFSDLSYLVLRSHVVREFSEMVREVHTLAGPHGEARHQEKLASNDDDPRQFSPFTRLVERTVEKQMGQQTPLTITNPVERIERTILTPSTIPLEPRIYRHVRTDARSTDSRPLRRDPSVEPASLRSRRERRDSTHPGPGVHGERGRDGETRDERDRFEKQLSARRTVPLNTDDALPLRESRFTASLRLTDERHSGAITTQGGQRDSSFGQARREDEVRWELPTTGIEEPSRSLRTQSDDRHGRTSPSSEITRELVGAGDDSHADTREQVVDSEMEGVSSSKPDDRTEDRVAERPGTTPGWHESRPLLTTRLMDSRPETTDERITARRERMRSSTRRTATTVLNTDAADGGDDERVRSDGPDARTRRDPGLHPARTDTILVGTSGGETPSPQHQTTRTPDAPALTVRTDRTNLGSSERDEREGGRDDGRVNGDTLRERQDDGESDNSIEKHIYSPESMNSRHMDTDENIDRLVDRLFTRLERKLRIERERRGL